MSFSVNELLNEGIADMPRDQLKRWHSHAGCLKSNSNEVTLLYSFYPDTLTKRPFMPQMALS